MADPSETDEPNGSAEEAEIKAEDLPGVGKEHPGRGLLVLCAGVVVIAGAAGYVAGTLSGCGGPESAALPAQAAGAVPEPAGSDEEVQYIDFEAITVNLDEPRLARYVCVTITLAVAAADYPQVSVEVSEKMPVLKDWLTVYFASCSLDDVRGAVNMNRMRREILDAFNEQLWPEQKPRISHVLFKKFTVS